MNTDQFDRRAAELAESWINGNRGHVYDELMALCDDPAEGAPTLAAMVAEMIEHLANHEIARPMSCRHVTRDFGHYLRTRAELGEPEPRFYECGICDNWHPEGFDGDCREDESRFTESQLDSLYGDDWERVSE